jgi:hypothetical protein
MRRALVIGLAPPHPEEDKLSSSGLLIGGAFILFVIGVVYATLAIKPGKQ